MMSPALSHAYDCLVMFGCGMIVSAVYSGISFFRSKMVPGPGISFFQDMLFWFFAGLMTCSGLYLCGYGALNLHSFLLLGLGCLCWARFFHKKFLSAFTGICGTMKKSLRSDKGVYGENGKKASKKRNHRKSGTGRRYRF
ncbi:MAG: spore cortex biosynthesis protein YabQ [Firmicutes bacterium]|nr:hypothetical protein [Clostridiales bacterium]MBQ9930823.1 spore cortex biosynthesis protein YabQ [Bacillota bacterium]